MRGAQIAAVLAAGAGAAQLGTAFLACPSPAPHAAAQAGADQPAVRPYRADPGLLRAPGPRPGQPLHARARPVRARRLPAGPPPDRAAAQGGRQGGRRRRAWRCGRGRGTGWRASCPPDGWWRCWRPNSTPRGPRCGSQREVPVDDRAGVRGRPLRRVRRRTARSSDGPEGRHAVSVKRLRAGEEVVLTDGAGHWARRQSWRPPRARTGWTSPPADVVARRSRRQPRITVVQALPKGDRGELAVETMTETGVDAIVPWAASRCITQWKGDRGPPRRSPSGGPPRGRRASSRAGCASLRSPTSRRRGRSRSCCAARLRGRAARGRQYAAGHGRTALGRGDRAGRRPRGRGRPRGVGLFAEAGAAPFRLGPTVLRTSTAGTAATALLLGRTGRWG